jgi:hypothetical protein
MNFFDTYGNPRPVEDEFIDYVAKLIIPKSQYSPYLLNRQRWGGENRYYLVDPSGKVRYAKELYTTGCRLELTSRNHKDGRKMSDIFTNLVVQGNGK